jgi:phosphatidylserine synthase
VNLPERSSCWGSETCSTDRDGRSGSCPVARTVPRFDGGRLDDIVDYLTYVFAPAVLLLTSERLPAAFGGGTVAALLLLSSCIQFCRTDAEQVWPAQAETFAEECRAALSRARGR